MLIHDDPNADNSADILALINDRRILPEGVYYCQRPLYVPNKSIVGEGTELRFPQMKDAPYCIGWINVRGCVFAGISVVGPTQGECLGPTRRDRIYTHGLVIRDSSECKLFDVTVERVVCQGINIANSTGLELHRVSALDTGRDGIFIRDSTDLDLRDCEAINTGDDSIALWSCAAGLLSMCKVLQRLRHGDDNRMGCGLRLGSCSRVTIRDTIVANTVKAGIHMLRDTYTQPPGDECDFIVLERVSLGGIADYNGPLWPRQATGRIVTGKSTRVEISQ